MTALVDPFEIPPAAKPYWMDYRWVRKSVMGYADTKNIEDAEKHGWRPVPRRRHWNLPAAKAWGDHEWTEYGGLILMERPDWMSQRAASEERRKAFVQGGSIPGQGARTDDTNGLIKGEGKTFAQMQPVNVGFWRRLWLKYFGKRTNDDYKNEEAY